MTFDSYTVETDPFLIELRQQLDKLEEAKNAAYMTSVTVPGSTRARIAYDAAWLRFDTAKMAYERALKAAIGL